MKRLQSLINSLLHFELACIGVEIRHTFLTTAFVILDTRYFMIKSWNSENVEIAQRDVSDLSL